jgi:uncharacterized coiled-coil protein SlyX
MSEDRLTAIESLLMHLQHDVEQLHEALVGYRKDLDGLREEMGKLRGQVERIEMGPEARDPKAERPPHY